MAKDRKTEIDVDTVEFDSSDDTPDVSDKKIKVPAKKKRLD